MKCKSLICPDCGEIASVLVDSGDLVVKDGKLQLQVEDGDTYISFEESLIDPDDFGECGDCSKAFRIGDFFED